MVLPTILSRSNASVVMDRGIETAPTKQSATAMLANRTLEFFPSSLLFFTATITKMFKRMVTGQATHVVAMAIWNVVVSLKVHMKMGSLGQKYTAGGWLEAFTARFVLPLELIFLPHGGGTQE